MGEAIGRPLVRACHRGIREFCLSAARVCLCDKRAVDHDQVLIRPSRSMFALLPAPSLRHAVVSRRRQ
jgi:hypothetical protein